MKKFLFFVFFIVIFLLVFLFMAVYSAKKVDYAKIKVGLVLNGTINDKSWGESHYSALKELENENSIELVYAENIACDETSKAVMENLISEGCSLIICNSYGFGDYELEVAKKHPDIYFLHASGLKYSENLSTYFGRIYQIRYLTGMVAGLQTQTNEIGYVAAFDIPEVIRGIDAFTMGARRVNKNAKVYVEYSNSWTDDNKNYEAAKKLMENTNMDILTLHCDSIKPLEFAEENGIWSIGYNIDNAESYPNSFLTAAVWEWKSFYEQQIQFCKSGKFHGNGYWGGIESGIVDIAPLTDNVKSGTEEIIKEYMEKFKSGSFDVFVGPI